MLGPLSSTIHGVVDFTWPMILISIVVLVSFRITYLIKNHERLVLYKELLMLSFIIYILCLFQVVTFQDNVYWSSNNFIPFKEILRYNITSNLFIKNVIGNMILFLPFGLFASLYLKVEKVHLPLVLSLITSIAIEYVQMSIGRVFDVDDIILNVLGGIIGYIIYKILKSIGQSLPSFCRKEWFLDILSILILVGIVSIILFI